MKKYTLTNFKISQMLAITFTVLFFLTRSLISADPLINAPDKIAIPIFLWDKCLIILVFMTWHMYQERYLHFRFWTVGNPIFLQYERKIGEMVVMIGVYGVGIFVRLQSLLLIFVIYRNNLMEICSGVLAEVLVTAFWLGGLLYYVVEVKKLQESKGASFQGKKFGKISKSVVLLALLLALSFVSGSYMQAKQLEAPTPIEYVNKYEKYYALLLATVFPVNLAGYF